MNNTTVAEIEIVTGGTSDHYPKLAVSIQNTATGVVAKNDFIFSEYLTAVPASVDRDIKLMHIWYNRHTDYDWYITKPVNTKPIVDAIFEYIYIQLKELI